MSGVEQRAAVVLGTRPEIIKLAGVVRSLGSRGYLVHTGQHYDDSLSAAFFASYQLPVPEVKLEGVGAASRGEQFSAIIGQLTQHFRDERPGAVVVQGDTNTAAAAAEAASFLGIPVVHVEAGLRSFDRAMPEEINRQLIGVVADVHCAPTEVAAEQLRREGVSAERVVVTGNTVVEATLESLPDVSAREQVLGHYGLEPHGFVLATIHRPENTDDPTRLRTILQALADLKVPVVLPIHPRTATCVERFGLVGLLEQLRTVTPLDHPTFLALAHEARLIVSDSGGIQEECTVLKRPLVVLRNSTERPEAVTAGFARRLVPDALLPACLRGLVLDDDWAASLTSIPSPYGDGTASERIARAVLPLLANNPTERSPR
ncbi:MAG: non-hydrolyzing UDP-N-acetylglucosamine 2-epimerase [Marmoricola sp.]